MPRPGNRWLRVAAVALVLPFLGAAPDESEEAPPPIPNTRRVLIISETCDPTNPEPQLHRRCVLRSLSDGDRLLVMDPMEDVAYQPYYESEKTAFRTLNDFAGLPAFIRGVWDEEHELLGRAATWRQAQKLFPDGAHEMLKPMHGIRLDEALRDELLGDGFCAWGAGIQ